MLHGFFPSIILSQKDCILYNTQMLGLQPVLENVIVRGSTFRSYIIEVPKKN